MERAFIDAFDTRIEVGARIDQPLGGFGQLDDHRPVALLRIAQTPLGPSAVAVWNLTRFDGPLRQQLGDDMHDARRYL